MNTLFEWIPRLGPGAEFILGFVIAVLITAHVLITKREIASSAGWIGLIWFAPLLGGFTYFVLGINRVRRRAHHVVGRHMRKRGAPRAIAPERQHDLHLRPLGRGIAAITGRPIEHGNAVTVLQNGDEAYPAMLAAIEGAKHSIGLSSYIMRGDAIGRRFIAALQAAQGRGVEVRVIIDGVGSGWILSPAYKLLRAAGLRAGRFMHSLMPWRMPFLNLRTHRKILVVDGAMAFVGGINIADQNLVAAQPRNPVQDTHFKLEGPSVAQLVALFAADWYFLTDEELAGALWFPALELHGDAAARVISAGPDQDIDKIEFALLQALACARESVRLMTPYFLPDQQMLTALSLAAMRGVRVEIIVPERSDHRVIDWAIRAHVGPLLRDGCHIGRSPMPFNHSKLLVVDGEWCLIGSSNWDIRSFRLNFEVCVEVYDGALAARLEGLMAQNRGRELTMAELGGANFPVRLRNAAARLLLPYL